MKLNGKIIKKTAVMAAVIILTLPNTAPAFAAPFGSAYERPPSKYSDRTVPEMEIPKITVPFKAPNLSEGGSANTSVTTPETDSGFSYDYSENTNLPSSPPQEALDDYYNNRVVIPTEDMAETDDTAGLPAQAERIPSSISVSSVTAAAFPPGYAEEPGEAAAEHPASNRQEPPEPGLVTLKESYDIAIGLYEEKFEVGRSFLTNVPNGASTADVVFLDLPQNMSVIAEFEGARIPYASKQRLTETGNYVFTVFCPKVTEDGSYRAVFSFRILRPLSIGKDDTDATKEKPQLPEYFNASSSNGKTEIEYIFSNHKRFYANVADREEVENAVYFRLPVNVGYALKYNGRPISYSSNKPLNEPGSYSMRITAPSFESDGKRAVTVYTDISFTIPMPPEELEALESAKDGGLPSAETVSDALTETIRNGVYLLSFTNGDAFASTVPNGGTSEIPVTFAIPQSIEYVLKRGNEIIEYVSGEPVSEPGSYTLSATTQPDAANRAYSAELTFEVAGTGQSADELINELGTSEPVESEPAASELETTAAEPQSSVPAFNGANIPEQTYGSKVFNQSIALDTYFTSSIPNGMMSREPAQFGVPENIPRKLYFNGEQIDFLGDETITEPGEYAMLTTNPVTGNEYLFYFTILSGDGNKALSFVPPLGYRVETVTKDDSPFSYSGETVSITADGVYIIQIAGDAGFPKYVINYTMDTIAPTLEITGIVNGKATGTEVLLTADDPDASITVLLDNKEQKYNYGSPLTKYGDYVVTITDLAGNFNEYKFSIPYTMNRTAILLVILLLLMAGGGAYYFFRLRKNVKVL